MNLKLQSGLTGKSYQDPNLQTPEADYNFILKTTVYVVNRDFDFVTGGIYLGSGNFAIATTAHDLCDAIVAIGFLGTHDSMIAVKFEGIGSQNSVSYYKSKVGSPA